MKLFTSRVPCLIFTHSRWRGDFSSRALAQSWACEVMAARAAATKSLTNRFIEFPVVRVVALDGDCSWRKRRSLEIQLVPFSRAHFDTQVCSNLLFEGIEVQVGVILVSVVVGVNDLRTKLAHGAAGFVRRHRVRDVDADKREFRPQIVYPYHYRN